MMSSARLTRYQREHRHQHGNTWYVRACPRFQRRTPNLGHSEVTFIPVLITRPWKIDATVMSRRRVHVVGSWVVQHEIHRRHLVFEHEGL